MTNYQEKYAYISISCMFACIFVDVEKHAIIIVQSNSRFKWRSFLNFFWRGVFDNSALLLFAGQRSTIAGTSDTCLCAVVDDDAVVVALNVSIKDGKGAVGSSGNRLWDMLDTLTSTSHVTSSQISEKINYLEVKMDLVLSRCEQTLSLPFQIYTKM